MDESPGKCTDGAGNEISRPGASNISFHNATGGKFIRPTDVRPIPHLVAKCSARIDEAKQSRAINSFCLQEVVARVSREEGLFAVKETSIKKAIWNKE